MCAFIIPISQLYASSFLEFTYVCFKICHQLQPITKASINNTKGRRETHIEGINTDIYNKNLIINHCPNITCSPYKGCVVRTLRLIASLLDNLKM